MRLRDRSFANSLEVLSVLVEDWHELTALLAAVAQLALVHPPDVLLGEPDADVALRWEGFHKVRMKMLLLEAKHVMRTPKYVICNINGAPKLAQIYCFQVCCIFITNFFGQKGLIC